MDDNPDSAQCWEQTPNASKTQSKLSTHNCLFLRSQQLVIELTTFEGAQPLRAAIFEDEKEQWKAQTAPCCVSSNMKRLKNSLPAMAGCPNEIDIFVSVYWKPL